MMNKFFNKSFTEPRFKKEQFSTCKIFQVQTSLCVIGLCGCENTKINTGKAMGEVYFLAWFQNRAAREIILVWQYTTLFWAWKSPTRIKTTVLTWLLCIFTVFLPLCAWNSIMDYFKSVHFKITFSNGVHFFCSTLLLMLLFKRKSSLHIQNYVTSMINFLRWDLALLAVSSHGWL